MKAILCTHFGGPDDLAFSDLPDPVPGQGEVVVAIKAAALNFFDTLIIAGKYQFKPPFPLSAGLGIRRRRGKRRSRCDWPEGRRPRARLWRPRRGARETRAPGAARGENPRHARLRSRRRHHGDLRHHAACAEGPRQAQTRRDAGGARRVRRNRPCGDRARQADGRARDRLRVVRRELAPAGARRRRDDQLREGRSEGGAAPRHGGQGRGRDLRSGGRTLRGSRAALDRLGWPASW